MTLDIKYIKYLTNMRQKGIVTKIGIIPYLQRDFNLTYDQAKKIVEEWNKIVAFN